MKIKIFLFSLLVTLSLLPPDCFAGSQGSSGRRQSSGYKNYRGAKAVDGDTFRYKGQRYRLRDYNAPERGKPGSKQATQSLQRRLDSGSYQYKSVAKDRYGRSIVEEQKAD